MKTSILFCLLIAFSLVSCALNDQVTEPHSSMTYSRSAYVAGRAEAERDIKNGVLAVESAGLPAEWSNEYDHLLKQRYGIEDRSVAGCVLDDTIIGHMRGYNEVSRAEINRRFGSEIFEKTAEEARALYQKKHPGGAL